SVRIGGAGIGGFYTKTGAGTEIAEGKEERVIDGENYILESAIKGDVSLIKALKADRKGNVIYDHTDSNFNVVMARASKAVIAERIIEDENYISERPIKGDVYLIKDMKADTKGNLIYDHTARNFNVVMATASKTVIAEVDEIVEVGDLKPTEVVTPHLYVDY